MDEWWHIAALRLLVIGVLAVGFIACGAGADGDGSSAATTPTADQFSPAQSRIPMQGQRTKGGTVACTSANVRLGGSPGAVDFKVRCRPRPGERTVSFEVSRAPVPGDASTGIKAFRHRPVATFADGSRTHGKCQIVSDDLVCRALTEQSVLVSGRIWVNPETRCDFEVIISGAIRRHCTEICSAVSKRVIITSSLPRGC
jgi:hypothetical protein